VIALTDTTSTIKRDYLWDDWGKSTGGTDNAGFSGTDRARWKGALWMGSEVDLYYMRNRWYEPHSGRFLSEDPIGLSGGINPVTFATNDPVNGADPAGLDPGSPYQLAGITSVGSRGASGIPPWLIDQWYRTMTTSAAGPGVPPGELSRPRKAGKAGGGKVRSALRPAEPWSRERCTEEWGDLLLSATLDLGLFGWVRLAEGLAVASREAYLLAGAARAAGGFQRLFEAGHWAGSFGAFVLSDQGLKHFPYVAEVVAARNLWNHCKMTDESVEVCLAIIQRWTQARRWWDCSRIPLTFAVGFSILAGGVSSSSGLSTEEKLGISFPALVLFYLAAGAGVGTSVLLFGGWATTRARGAFLGFAVGTLVSLALNFILPDPVRGWSALVPMSGVGLILGAPAGAMYWKPPSAD